MPTSVVKLFGSLRLSIEGPVKWGQHAPADEPGVYVVSLSPDPNDIKTKTSPAPIDLDSVRNWIGKVPTLVLDGDPPTPETLKERISKFWLPDETVLYIGQTNRTLRRRIDELYIHKLGEKRPHSGGHWLKTLSILERLYVFWACTPAHIKFKKLMLKKFMENVSHKTEANPYASKLPLPFANLELTKGERKKHGIDRSRLR